SFADVWETRNVRKGDERLSLDMLLIDEQPTIMQGSVSSSRIPKFRNPFNEGSVYTLNCFDVTRTNPNFRLSMPPSQYDDTDTTAFLGFDMEVARLPNIQASQAAQIVEGAQVLEAAKLKLWHKVQSPKLITLAMLETSYLHLMVHLPDVQHQRKNKLLRMRMLLRSTFGMSPLLGL
ncbi:hypothetical protein HID58_020358, partial [Brassica napus]